MKNPTEATALAQAERSTAIGMPPLRKRRLYEAHTLPIARTRETVRLMITRDGRLVRVTTQYHMLK